MAILATFEKQPIEVQDYDISFVGWLNGLSDTGSSVVYTSTPGLTINSCVLNAGVVKVWTAGGVDGNSYTISVTLTTTIGRIKQVEIIVKVKDK